MRTEDGVESALDELVTAAAAARDDVRSRAALASVVLSLERSAGSSLGTTAGDPLVVLQRRLGRAHRLLATGGSGAVTSEEVRGHVATLCSRVPVQRGVRPGQRRQSLAEGVPVAC